MAVDEALLIDAADNGIATVRFYQWQESTLSLGYFQRYDDRYEHAPSRDCAIVRRQTGGGAIVHDRELTYSLTLPASHPLARQSQPLYAAVHDAFIVELLSCCDVDAKRFQPSVDQESNHARREQQPFLCFERRAQGDVVVVGRPVTSDSAPPQVAPPPFGWKILGSAQRRHRGAILQHGSLLLDRSPAAPELPGLRNLIARTFSLDDALAGLTVRLAEALKIELTPIVLPPRLESIARELAINKYTSEGWTKRR
jgi:lipoate-protein ligase A